MKPKKESVILICPCGKEFTPQSGKEMSATYCSRECCRKLSNFKRFKMKK